MPKFHKRSLPQNPKKYAHLCKEMTFPLCYPADMNALLSVAKEGILWILVLFVLCFAAVHAGKLALLGWQIYRHNAAPEGSERETTQTQETTRSSEERSEKRSEEKSEPTPTQAPQPVYYLVEKKRVKQKPKYAEPKRIDFKT